MQLTRKLRQCPRGTLIHDADDEQCALNGANGVADARSSNQKASLNCPQERGASKRQVGLTGMMCMGTRSFRAMKHCRVALECRLTLREGRTSMELKIQ
jgi:hypothetical protein